jgi:hypothetical protein
MQRPFMLSISAAMMLCVNNAPAGALTLADLSGRYAYVETAGSRAAGDLMVASEPSGYCPWRKPYNVIGHSFTSQDGVVMGQFLTGPNAGPRPKPSSRRHS